jgi:hypothetical protein
MAQLVRQDQLDQQVLMEPQDLQVLQVQQVAQEPLRLLLMFTPPPLDKQHFLALT